MVGITPNLTTRWTLTDQVGSVRKHLGLNGDISASFTYNTFGQLLRAVGSSLPNGLASITSPATLLFTAREFDSTSKLGYYRARMYAAGVGRFASEDGFVPWNYEYVANSPQVLTDPSGFMAVTNSGVTKSKTTVPAAKAAKQTGPRATCVLLTVAFGIATIVAAVSNDPGYIKGFGGAAGTIAVLAKQFNCKIRLKDNDGED